MNVDHVDPSKKKWTMYSKTWSTSGNITILIGYDQARKRRYYLSANGGPATAGGNVRLLAGNGEPAMVKYVLHTYIQAVLTYSDHCNIVYHLPHSM